MKKFKYADIYLLKGVVYGGLGVYSNSHTMEKGWFLLSAIMFVFYLELSLKNDKSNNKDETNS